MKTNPVGWFEIPTKDIERARAFYAAVFGYEFQDLPFDDPSSQMVAFPMVEGAPNCTGALVQTDGQRPSMEGTIVYFSSADVAEELGRVEGAGGEILQPKMSIGEYGFIGILKDTEGNRIGIHSRH